MKGPGSTRGLGISKDCDVEVGKEVHYKAAVPWGYWRRGGIVGDDFGTVDVLLTLGGIRRVMIREGSRTTTEVVPVDGVVEVEGADEEDAGRRGVACEGSARGPAPMNESTRWRTLVGSLGDVRGSRTRNLSV